MLGLVGVCAGVHCSYSSVGQFQARATHRILAPLFNVSPQPDADVFHHASTSKAQKLSNKKPVPTRDGSNRGATLLHRNISNQIDRLRPLNQARATPNWENADALGFDNGALSGQSY